MVRFFKILCLAVLAITSMSLMLDKKASKELVDMTIDIDNYSQIDSVHNFDFIDKAIAKAEAEECDTIKSFLLLNKVTYHAYFGSIDEALECLETLKYHTEKTGYLESCLYDAWFNIIMLYRTDAQTVPAMLELNKMLDYAKQHDSQYGLATAYCLFADVYEASYNTAKENLELALEHLEKGGYKGERYEVYYQMAYLASVHGKYEDVLKYTKKMVEVNPVPISMQVADHLALEAYCQLGDHENAQKIYERVQGDWDNDKIGVGTMNSALSGLIAYHSQFGDPNKIPKLVNYYEDNNEIAKLKSEVIYYAAKNDYKKAYELMTKANDLEKEKLMQLQEAEVATMNTIFKTSELKEEKHQLEIDKAASRNQRNVVIIFAMALMLACALYIIYTTKKHNRNLKIERDNTEAQRQIAEEQRIIAEEQRKIAEEERNNAVRLNELKTEFLNTMSHEMRTPLNSIIGFNDLLNNPNFTLSPEKKQEMMGHINFHSLQLMHLLDHVVILSRIDCNDAKPVPEDIDIKQIAETLYYENEERIPKSVKMDISGIADGIKVKTDSEFVTIILRELIDNAIKFTKEGKITVSATQTDNGAKIIVKDTGVGLPKDNLDEIYNRFEKFTSFEAGFGLGLSCCKELIDIIKSRISIDTSYTSGACFIVDLTNMA